VYIWPTCSDKRIVSRTYQILKGGFGLHVNLLQDFENIISVPIHHSYTNIKVLMMLSFSRAEQDRKAMSDSIRKRAKTVFQED